MSQAGGACAPALTNRFKDWIVSVGLFWAASIAGHMLLLIILALVWGTVHVASTIIEGPDEFPDLPEIFASASIDFTRIDQNVEQPRELRLVDFALENLPVTELAAESFTNTTEPISNSMSVGSDVPTLASLSGPMRGSLVGTELPGSIDGTADGPAHLMDARNDPTARRLLRATGGGTQNTDLAVFAALDWLARHQLADGSWSMNDTKHCTDDSCTHAGSVRSSSAATSFALLPFLAAGMTPVSKSIVSPRGKKVDYSRTVAQGLTWLVSHQREDGNLADGTHVMYTHGLATIALCEAFAMTHDRRIGDAAQAAVRFIERAQNQEDGGWRYTPGAVPGDTSVVGWQVMALKSAQLAGLKVSPETLSGVKRYLKRASVAGRYGGVFSYLPDDKAGKISMTAVGMLCNQYMGLERGDPALLESQTALLKNLPSRTQPNIYYWYYATQAMHNMPGPEWDAWNRVMRRVLVETQTKEGCALGSWNPEVLSDKGHVAEAGGRLMATSLAALSLEVYYRYLPLYKTVPLETAAR